MSTTPSPTHPDPATTAPSRDATVVTATGTAEPDAVVAHVERLLRYETDCWDVHHALGAGGTARPVDFVLLDVRHPDHYAAGHVPGAVNLPVGRILPRNLAAWPTDAVFVVYCAGPHCNGADRAALALARLGRRVKRMTGGVTGWLDEGFALSGS